MEDKFKFLNDRRLISYNIVFDRDIRELTSKYWDKHSMADWEWFKTLSYVPFEVGEHIKVPICHDAELLAKCEITSIEKTVFPGWGCGQDRYAGECDLVIYIEVKSVDIENLTKEIEDLS